MSQNPPLNPLLKGIRILDVSRLLPGPFCSFYLAQMGAEVIKIEEPGVGDYARDMSAELFTLVNRGKQSVVLDLRKPEDAEAFRKLADTADVVLESFRPGVMKKLGCDYDTLRARNPKLVYAALTGYGQTGPYANRPGHDMNYRAYAGELDQNAVAGGAPVQGNVQFADLAGGALTCAVGILGAVIGAQASGQGTMVDVGMMDGTMALQMAALGTRRAMGATPPRGHDFLGGGLPNYFIYETCDGKHLAMGALEPKFFKRTLELAGAQDLLKLPMVPGPKGEPLRDALKALIKTRTRDEWEALLAHEDTCVSGIYTLDEALLNEQVTARGFVEDVGGKPAFGLPIRFSHAAPTGGDSPRLGEHTDAVLGRPPR
ncbi:CaiB/BaiF CoA transferase family protein [Polycyclovorans algicola]|uniref:CaiB/BaiF CoA transferase family protein n=1 Tax=Polycyclovorans algicola TaxID=616992 RepID=UPI0005B8E5AB|nr:CaiB/BaiF CoA-transferase family protein [Polycyclovorans algicola]